MSRRALSLPLRLASSQHTSSTSWTCRRCLATQSTTATTSPVPDHVFQQTVPEPSSSFETPSQNTSTSSPDYQPALPASQRNYPLSIADRSLKKPLPHPIPLQHLQHSSTPVLSDAEKVQREKTVPHKPIVGVVVSAGKMHKTVKVRIPGQRWEKRIGKYFASHTNHLVHDPNSSLVPGDVVSLHRLRVSTAVHHVVASIVTPFGTPIEERNPIPTPDERLAEYKTQRFAKLKRRQLRRDAAMGDADAIRELRAMGLEPDASGVAGSGKGGVKGAKGQVLPKGVLPGGQHAVGKIDERAKRNKGMALAFEEKKEGNLREAMEREEETKSRGVNADPTAGTKVTRGRTD